MDAEFSLVSTNSGLMLEDFEIRYVETNYTKESWPEIKKKGIETGLFTFGQGKAEVIFCRICKLCHTCMRSTCPAFDRFPKDKRTSVLGKFIS